MFLGNLVNRVGLFKDKTTLEVVEQPDNFLTKAIMITPVVINKCKHDLRWNQCNKLITFYDSVWFFVKFIANCLRGCWMSDWLRSRYLLVQSQQWKHQNYLWNLVKAKNKDTRTTSYFEQTPHTFILMFQLMILNN